MDINERVKALGPYFKSLNMVDGAVVVLVKFPEKWKVFNKEEIFEEFNVQVGKKEEVDGTFFVGEIADGLENVFDAIESVISQNKTLEEKAELLEAKAKELRDLFISEPLEKLKTLEFTFKVKNTARKSKNAVKTEETVEEPEEKSNPIQLVEFRPEDLVERKEEKPKKQAKSEKKAAKNNDDSDVMSFMKDLEGGKK